MRKNDVEETGNSGLIRQEVWPRDDESVSLIAVGKYQRLLLIEITGIMEMKTCDLWYFGKNYAEHWSAS